MTTQREQPDWGVTESEHITDGLFKSNRNSKILLKFFLIRNSDRGYTRQSGQRMGSAFAKPTAGQS
jgi:hypothetical protein